LVFEILFFISFFQNIQNAKRKSSN